jgi:hypothetical protein
LSNSVQALSEDENKFLDSLGSPKLKNCADDVILAALKYGMILLGIRGDNAPLEVGMVLLVKTCKTEHGNLTIKELRLAFEMASGLKLEFNPNTYQNFSVLYLNELMYAYKKWSTQAYDYLRPNGDRQDEREQEDYSPYILRSISLNSLMKEIQQGYEFYLAGSMTNSYYIPYEWHRVLVEDGFIEDAVIKFNKRMSQLTDIEKAFLVEKQNAVYELFEQAKRLKVTNIYKPC